MFQSYVQSALAFSIKRGGILYGNKDEEGHVTVHAIYEPPQVRVICHFTHVTVPVIYKPPQVHVVSLYTCFCMLHGSLADRIVFCVLCALTLHMHPMNNWRYIS